MSSEIQERPDYYRIFPIQVFEAYLETGLEPIRDAFCRPEKNEGDPFAAVYCSENPVWPAYCLGFWFHQQEVNWWAQKRYGFDYVDGFRAAVRGDQIDDDYSPHLPGYRAGFRDGQSVADALFPGELALHEAGGPQ